MSDTVVPFPRRSGAPGAAPEAKKPQCAICGKEQVERFRPFCSKRCAQIDLGRWLGERYRIPTGEIPGGASDGEREGEEES